MDNPQLEDYRAIQRQRYMEREKARLEAEEAAAREAKEKEEKVNEALRQIDVYLNLARSTNNLVEMLQIMDNFTNTLSNTPDIPKQALMGKGLDLLEYVNGNANISVDMRNVRAKESSERLKEAVKAILGRCGLDAEDLNLEFEMDCSRDEEIAKALSETFLTPPPPKKKRGRPPKPRNS